MKMCVKQRSLLYYIVLNVIQLHNLKHSSFCHSLIYESKDIRLRAKCSCFNMPKHYTLVMPIKCRQG